LTIVDTNILLDIVTDDQQWIVWSLTELERAALNGPLIVNDVVYAELSVRFDRMEALDEVLVGAGLTIEPIPRSALFLAGKAFQSYRTAGGMRTGVLPDSSLVRTLPSPVAQSLPAILVDTAHTCQQLR
jgi:predicted nucleic acid-binding protein